jgi:hypothetical protein
LCQVERDPIQKEEENGKRRNNKNCLFLPTRGRGVRRPERRKEESLEAVLMADDG